MFRDSIDANKSKMSATTKTPSIAGVLVREQGRKQQQRYRDASNNEDAINKRVPCKNKHASNSRDNNTGWYTSNSCEKTDNSWVDSLIRDSKKT
jgi:hypothetical protein